MEIVDVKKIALDTSAIMNDCKIIEKLLSEGFQVFINIVVIEELDNLKTKEYTVSKKARMAIREIESNKEFIVFDTKRNIHEKLQDELNTYNFNDDIIVSCAERNNCILSTDDFNLKIKSEIIGVPVYETKVKTFYQGYKVVIANNEQLSKVYDKENTENVFECLTNEYVIINNEQNEFIDVLKWNGEKYIAIYSKNIKTLFFGDKLKAKDIYQRMAIDSLLNNTITCISGKAGSGKSLLSLMTATYLLENGAYDRIVILFNPCGVRGATQIGYYTGSMIEKAMQSSIGHILVTKFGDRYVVDNYIAQGKIKLVPMSDCRGMEIKDNEILFITEAENTTSDLMKICLSRVSSGAKVFIEGDFDQTDNTTFDIDNGMERMIDVFKGEKEFGFVELQNVWRSRIAEITDKM